MSSTIPTMLYRWKLVLDFKLNAKFSTLFVKPLPARTIDANFVKWVKIIRYPSPIHHANCQKRPHEQKYSIVRRARLCQQLWQKLVQFLTVHAPMPLKTLSQTNPRIGRRPTIETYGLIFTCFTNFSIEWVKSRKPTVLYCPQYCISFIDFAENCTSRPGYTWMFSNT